MPPDLHRTCFERWLHSHLTETHDHTDKYTLAKFLIWDIHIIFLSNRDNSLHLLEIHLYDREGVPPFLRRVHIRQLVCLRKDTYLQKHSLLPPRPRSSAKSHLSLCGLLAGLTSPNLCRVPISMAQAPFLLHRVSTTSPPYLMFLTPMILRSFQLPGPGADQRPVVELDVPGKITGV